MAKDGNTPSKAPEPLNLDVFAHELEAATGSTSVAFQRELLAQLASTLSMPHWKTAEQNIQAAKGVYEVLQRIAPRSELEAMLAAQMISTHSAAMECLRRAMHEGQSSAGRDQNFKHATKLMSLYERQLAALDKRRSRRQQKIRGEHVTVQTGGQAIVDEVEAVSAEPGSAAPSPAASRQMHNVDGLRNSKSVGGKLTGASQTRPRGNNVEQ